MTQSPIFSKTHDFLKWLLPHTGKFPKNERFRLAARTEQAALDFHECLVRAAKAADQRRYLLEADVALDRLRLLIRLCMELKLLGFSQYEYAAGQLTEIGRLLGGWGRSLGHTTRTASPAARAPS